MIVTKPNLSKFAVVSGAVLALLLSSCGTRLSSGGSNDNSGSNTVEGDAAAADLAAALFDDEGSPPTVIRAICANGPQDAVSVGRTYSVDDPHANSATSGQRTDQLSPGPMFGRSSSSHPNVGFTNRSRTIINGSPNGVQPRSLSCGFSGYAVVGWNFSNNAAGLRDVIDLSTVASRISEDRSHVVTRVTGRRVATYIDPSITSPVQPENSSASSAYYDQSFDGGVGRSVFWREVAYGTAAQPNRVIVSKITGTKNFSLYTESGRPVTESIERELEGGALMVKRTYQSGTLVAAFDDGAQARYTFDNVVMRRGNNGHMSCAPVSGRLTTVITPRAGDTTSDGQHVTVTVMRQYRDGSETSDVRCSPSTRSCGSYARIKNEAYGSESCFY